MDGWISLHRRILESGLCPKGKFSRFEAWVYILLTTNHKDTKWNGIIIKRGENLTSQKKLANIWQWSLGYVNKFLNKLKSENRIEIKPTNKYTILVIINYDKYQRVNDISETKSEIKVKPKENQSETYNKDNKDNKDNNNINVEKIFDFYLSKFNKDENKYKLTTKRKLKLQQRIRDCGEDMLKEAIEKVANSKFHRGDNDRGWQADLDFIIRSYEQVERLSQLEGSIEEKTEQKISEFMKGV
jgi:hypothetical protein